MKNNLNFQEVKVSYRVRGDYCSEIQKDFYLLNTEAWILKSRLLWANIDIALLLEENSASGW